MIVALVQEGINLGATLKALANLFSIGLAEFHLRDFPTRQRRISRLALPNSCDHSLTPRS